MAIVAVKTLYKTLYIVASKHTLYSRHIIVLREREREREAIDVAVAGL